MPRESSLPRDRKSRLRWTAWHTAALGVLTMLLATAFPAQAINCLTQKMQESMPSDLNLEEFANQPRTHVPGHPMAPPADPQVGDSWLWYLWYFAGGPPHAVETMCTVRGLGDNVYVIVDDAAWNVWVDQADVDQIVANWDNESYGNWPTTGIFDLETQNFGPTPDALDNDPRIYVVLYDWDVTGADGYWNWQDELPDNPPGRKSNECECLYVDASTSHPGGPSGTYLTAVMAHEFEHMIHWVGDTNEDAWVNEGLAELAMWLYGNPDQISGFNSQPDNDLTAFSNYADYVQTYLWSLYLYEHFGGTPTILALVANPSNSIAGVQATLVQMGYTETVAEVVRDWVTANYLDDPTLDGGKYNYEGEDLPTFAAVTRSSYPVPTVNTSLNHWAGEYVKFINGEPQRLNFDGGDGVLWYARAIKFLGGVPLSLEDMTLDGTSAGYLGLTGFGTDYDEVVMVVVNASPSGLTTYQYSTDADVTSVDGPLASNGGLSLSDVGPNPFAQDATLMLNLEQPARVHATIYDVTGAQVRALTLGSMDAGSHLLRWDGLDEVGSPAANGVYLLRIATDDGSSLNHRLVRVR